MPEEVCCLNCAMVAWQRYRKEDGPEDLAPLTAEQHAALHRGERPKVDRYVCAHRVWGPWEGSKEPDEKQWQELTLPRGEKCFFYLWKEGMGIVAAIGLERRQADRCEADRDREVTRQEGKSGREFTRQEGEKDRKLTRRALVVTMVIAVATILTAVASLVQSCRIQEREKPSASGTSASPASSSRPGSPAASP